MDLVKRLRTRDRANITLEKESKNKGQERKESLKYRCFFKTQQLGAGCTRSLGVRNWSHLKTKGGREEIYLIVARARNPFFPLPAHEPRKESWRGRLWGQEWKCSHWSSSPWLGVWIRLAVTLEDALLLLSCSESGPRSQHVKMD